MKPILFNTEMVQAILEGRKTVTRRVVKPQPKLHSPLELKCDGFEQREHEIGTNKWNEVQHNYLGEKFYSYGRTAPYKTGDILYVREKFNNDETTSILYAADKEFIDFGCKEVDGYLFMESEIKWKPSIHMPKEAARIFLKVTNVRVERLGDITEEQARKEGTKLPSSRANFVNSFIPLWDSTIKKNGIDKYGWEANPWVWVIEFERIKDAE